MSAVPAAAAGAPPRPLPAPPLAPGPVEAASPYKSLAFYERGDASSFAGRDQDIDDIAAGVARSRCFVLYGRSGLGKTSVLHAGVIPRLEQREFEVKYVRLLGAPIADLCAALAAHVGRDAVATSELPAVLAQRPRPFVLVLDQFEEFFIRFRAQPEIRAQFTALLGQILDEGAGWVRLLVSVREDYYAELEDLQTAIPDLTAERHRLVSLSAYGVRQAVVRPLIRARIGYEERFVDRLVDELAAFDFDPPLLQIVCGEVYDDAVRDAHATGGAAIELREAHIEGGGGVRGALTRYVAAVGAALDGGDRLLACAVLDALTTAENTKRALRFADLLPPTAPPTAAEPDPARPGASGVYLRCTPDELRRVLDRLCSARLVRLAHGDDAGRAGPSASGEWYELLHDRLVPVVKAWLDSDPEFDRFRFARKLVASLSSGRTWRDEPGGLLSSGQLSDQIQPYVQRLRLSPGETEYVLRSAIQHLDSAVPAWAAAYDEVAGAGSAAALVRALFAQPRPAVRARAANAAADVPDPDRALPVPCVALALDDPEDAVRRAAGRSVAKLATAAELEPVRHAVTRKITSVLVGRSIRERLIYRGGLEVVTDLVQFGGPTAGFSSLTLLAANRHRKRRVFHEHRIEIQDRSALGTRHGLMGTVALAGIAGLPAAAAFQLFRNPECVTEHWLTWLIVTLYSIAVWTLITAVFGGLTGWRSGRRMVRREALGQPPRTWISASVRAPVGLGVTSLLLVLAFMMISEGGRSGDLTTDGMLALVLALTAALGLAGPLAVRWILAAIPPGSSMIGAALWSAIVATAAALAPSVAGVLLAWTLGGLPGTAVETAIAVAVVCGHHLCVTGLVVYGGTRGKPDALAAAPPARRRLAQRAAIAVVVAIPIASFALLGPGTTPLWPRVISVDGATDATIEGVASSGRALYARIDAPGEAVVWSTSEGLVATPDGPDDRVRVMRDASMRYALRTSPGHRYALHVRATPIHRAALERTGNGLLSNAMPDRPTDQWTFAWAWARPTVRDPLYCIEVTIPGTNHATRSDDRVVELQLVWSRPDPRCRGESRYPCPLVTPIVDGTPRSAIHGGQVLKLPAESDGTWRASICFGAPNDSEPKSPEQQILVGYRLRSP